MCFTLEAFFEVSTSFFSGRLRRPLLKDNIVTTPSSNKILLQAVSKH